LLKTALGVGKLVEVAEGVGGIDEVLVTSTTSIPFLDTSLVEELAFW
jgi:hypothetical protein